jgi:hypothetical protein
MDALAEVCNEEIHLRDAGLLKSATILAARSSAGHSSSTRPAAPVPLVSPSVVPPAARGESVDLHCDHYGRDGHMEVFCYRKKKAQKAQAHRSSQGTGGTHFGRSERGSTSSETQEILMLLHRLAASTSSGVVGSMTQPSTLTGLATASQSSDLGPFSAPSLGTDPWYLDSGAFSYDSSFCLSFCFASFLSSLHYSYHRWFPSFCCWTGHAESASRPLVDFGVLND